MKKFLIRAVFLLILPFLVIGYALQFYFDKKLQESNLSNYTEWSAIFNSEINADLLILGNSRALRHISPYVLDSTFSLNSYNLGINGYPFQMEYYRFQCYLRYNKKPKYIILNVDPLTLKQSGELFMLEQFIPYLNKDENIRKAVEGYNVFDARDYYLPFYKYSHSEATRELIYQSLTSEPSENSKKYKGFLMKDKSWDTAFSSFKKSHPKGYRVGVDPEMKKLLASFVQYCKKEKIVLIFVNCPEYYEGQNLINDKDSVMNIFRQHSVKYEIPFLNYSNDSLCFDTANFYNSQHMNKAGATKFNIKLANDLKTIIKQ